jgi:flagellar biosynthesis protein FlhG
MSLAAATIHIQPYRKNSEIYMAVALTGILVGEAVRRQKPVSQLYPNGRASRCHTALARRIMANSCDNRLKGNIQFLSGNNLTGAAGLERI